MVAGCEESSVVESKIDYKVKFEKSDVITGTYLNKLDTPSSKDKRKDSL